MQVLNPDPIEIYRETSYRANWDNPTHEEMVKSLNKAHSANRTIEENLNFERKCNKYWRNGLLWALGATWTILGFLVKFLLPWAIKGMMLPTK